MKKDYKPPVHMMPWFDSISSQIYLYLLSRAYVNTRKANNVLLLPCCCLVTIRGIINDLPQNQNNKTTRLATNTVRKRLRQLEEFDEIRMVSREGDKGTAYLVTRKWDGIYGDTMNISQFYADSALKGLETLNDSERSQALMEISDAREGVLKRGLVKIKDKRFKTITERFAQEANDPFNQGVIGSPDPKDFITDDMDVQEYQFDKEDQYIEDEDILSKDVIQEMIQEKREALYGNEAIKPTLPENPLNFPVVQGKDKPSKVKPDARDRMLETHKNIIRETKRTAFFEEQEPVEELDFDSAFDMLDTKNDENDTTTEDAQEPYSDEEQEAPLDTLPLNNDLIETFNIKAIKGIRQAYKWFEQFDYFIPVEPNGIKAIAEDIMLLYSIDPDDLTQRRMKHLTKKKK